MQHLPDSAVSCAFSKTTDFNAGVIVYLTTANSNDHFTTSQLFLADATITDAPTLSHVFISSPTYATPTTVRITDKPITNPTKEDEGDVAESTISPNWSTLQRRFASNEGCGRIVYSHR